MTLNLERFAEQIETISSGDLIHAVRDGRLLEARFVLGLGGRNKD
ncbi:hypothetical protein [Starkeya sp. ORNL1]|nr:hypothetical protein [Starkeya sp. ORNL1]